MESVTARTNTETAASDIPAQDTATAAEHGKSTLSESAEWFNSLLNSALQ